MDTKWDRFIELYERDLPFLSLCKILEAFCCFYDGGSDGRMACDRLIRRWVDEDVSGED